MKVKAEKAIENLFNLSLDMTCISTTEGEIIKVNPAFTRVLGYTADEILKLGWAKLVHPDDVEKTNRQVGKQSKGKVIINFINRLRCKDGTYKILEWQATPSTDGLVYATARDITERKEAEHKLTENSEKFRQLYENLPLSYQSLDFQGNLIIVNQAWLDLLGYSKKEEVIGRTFWDFITERDLFVERFPKFKECGLTHGALFEMIRKDGSTILVSIDGRVSYDREGNFIQTHCVLHDVTEKKKVEDELKFRSEITEQLNASVITTGLDFRIYWVNQAFSSLYGYSSDELIGKTPDFLNIDPMSEEIQNDIYQTVSSGEVWTGEAMNRKKDGTIFPCEMNIFPLKDEQGNIFAYAGHQLDITERKKAEEERAQLLERLKAQWEIARIFDASQKTVSDIVLKEIVSMTKSKYGFYGFINEDESVMRIHAWSEEVMNDCAIVHKPLDFPIVKAGVWGNAIREKKINIINDLKEDHPDKKGTPEGHVLIDRTMVIPVIRHNRAVAIGSVANKDNDYTEKDAEQVSAFLHSAQLIYDKKKVEEEREQLNIKLGQKNRELEQIVYVTSHDLRTPLVNIDGFTKMIGEYLDKVSSILDSDRVSAEVKEEISSIVEKDIPEAEKFISRSVAKMESLLSGLLQISRIGRLEQKKVILDMNKMLSIIQDTFKFQIDKAGVKLEVTDLPSCKGDETQVNQVFSNLIDNALKYPDPARPGVIKISGQKDNGNSVYCVEDNGIGIKPEHQGKIFEIFHQLNPKEYQGEGLGLSIVGRILDRHSGKVWVESEVGKGSKFFVSLPRA